MTNRSIGSVRLPARTYRTILRKAVRHVLHEDDGDFDVDDWLRRAVPRRLNRYRRAPDRVTVSATGASALRLDFPVAALFPFGQRGEALRARFPILLRPKPLTLSIAFGVGGAGAFQPEPRNPASTED